MRHAVGRAAFLRMVVGEMTGTASLSCGTVFAVALALVSRMAVVRTVQSASRVTGSIEKGVLTGQLAWAFTFHLCFNAVLISVSFCYRRFYLNLVTRRIEISSFRSNMGLEYACFYSEDPHSSLQKMNRQTQALRDGVEVLLFDAVAHLVTIFFSSRTLMGLVETWKIALNLLGLCVLFCVQVLMFGQVLTLRSDAVRSEEAKLQEFAGLYDNFKLVRRSNEDDYRRIQRIYKDKINLKHCLLQNLFHFTTGLYLAVLYALVLYSSASARGSIVLFSGAFALLSANVSGLARCLLSLDNQRMGISSRTGKRDLEEAGEGVRLREGIRIRGASIFVKGKTVLMNINLDFKKSEVVALVGANGTGKTVFFKFLLGFLRFTGSVAVDSREVCGAETDGYKCLSGRMRGVIGYCPASPHVVGNTVYDNIRNGHKDLAGVVEASKRYRMHECFNRLGYLTAVDDITDQGDLQMINIMRAISRKSDILLLDEPTNYLGAKTGARVLDEIIRNRDGRLVIVVVHRPEELSRFDKIVSLGSQTAAVFDTYKDYLRAAETKQWVK